MKTHKLLTILAVATLPFFAACVSEAERQRIAAEQAEQARIAKEAAQKRAEEAAKARAEKEKRLAAEQEERRQQALAEARKILVALEKRPVRARLQGKIFPSEEKLREEERSRGWILLTEFGEAHMPQLMERCATARRNFLEAKANLAELVAALKAEDPSFNPDADSDNRSRNKAKSKTNPIFETAKNRLLALAAEYWWLRYKLTDNYSAFKVGALTADELAAKDEELAELLK